LSNVEFNPLSFVQVIELNAAAGRHVKENVLVAAIAGLDKSETLVSNTLNFAFAHNLSVLFSAAKSHEMCPW